MITPIRLTIDEETGVGYIRVTDAPVARTVEFSDDFLVDLDEFNMVVGVEVLDTNVEIPMAEIARVHHVPSDAQARWNLLEQATARHRALRVSLSVGTAGVSGNAQKLHDATSMPSGELYA